MPTETEIWDAACEKALGSKRGRCGGKTFWFSGELRCDLCRWTRPLPLSQIQGTISQEPHNTPAPTIDDPAAVVGMVEYVRLRLDAEKFVAIFRPTNWKRALANAVLAVPQETQP